MEALPPPSPTITRQRRRRCRRIKPLYSERDRCRDMKCFCVFRWCTFSWLLCECDLHSAIGSGGQYNHNCVVPSPCRAYRLECVPHTCCCSCRCMQKMVRDNRRMLAQIRVRVRVCSSAETNTLHGNRGAHTPGLICVIAGTLCAANGFEYDFMLYNLLMSFTFGYVVERLLHPPHSFTKWRCGR